MSGSYRSTSQAVLTTFDDDEDENVYAALRAGASGVVDGYRLTRIRASQQL